ncbi:MAG: Lsr2 family protein [Actinomycetales bacterium]|nr:MAG: Lsr2 family protein [Actinomycetales bacterium]
MAKKTIEKYFSDISGHAIDENSPTLYFSFDGTSYEIDLTAEERTAFKDAIAPYLGHARAVRGTSKQRTSTPSASSGHDPKAVRAWAVEQGLDVPARGRIPATLVQEYDAAH